MKKTILALFALSGMSMAATINPITDPSAGTWGTLQNQQDDITINREQDKITSSDKDWNADFGFFQFAEAMSLTSANRSQKIVFSYTLTSSANSAQTLALLDSTSSNSSDSSKKGLAIVTGRGGSGYSSDNNLSVGTSNNLSSYTEDNGAHGYLFGGAGNDSHVQNTSVLTSLEGGAPVNSSTDITGTIAWNGNSYALTMKSSAVADKVVTLDLGVTEVNLDGLIVTLDGEYAGAIGNLSISSVPEPATATLSLLALAGLAARRRRK